MFSDICFFKNKQGVISLYPSLEYVSNVIEESMVQAASLKGLRQLSIIRREEGNNKHTLVIYNYRYSISTDSFGICLVFKDYYPCGVGYLFSYMGKVVAEIVKEGKVLYIDKGGLIHTSKRDINKFSAVLNQHKNHLQNDFKRERAELEILSSLPSYYSIFKNQTIVHQLSDASWSITESLNYNNIVVITEEIEEENIKSMRSFIKKSNETIGNLNKRIASLEAQLKRVKKENKNVSGGKRHFGAIHYIFIITCLLIMITVLTHECPRLQEQTVDYIIEDTTENNAKTEPFIDTIPNESFISTPDTSSVVTSVTDFNVLNSDNDLLYVYTGEVVNSAPHGYGKAIYPDGREYEGFFVNGERNGENARFVFSDGNFYEGSFVNDHIGTGRLTSKQKSSFGTYFIGSFKDDKPYNGTWYNKDGKIISEIHGQ